MNKTFFMALMLASGMALAQSSGSYGSPDQSQPSSQQSQPSTQPSQPSTQQSQPSSSQNPTSSGQSSLTGCLKGSDGSWVLIAEGQSTPVTGDSSTLAPHNGHQVQLKGTPASDGSFQVTDVVVIAESCPSQQNDASSGAAAAAGATAGAVRTVAQNSSSADQNSSNPQSSTQSNPPASDQSATQPATPSTTQSTQPSSSAGQPSTGDTGTAQKKLPQTASPLPLLGLLGLGSLATGLIARRKK